MRITQEPTGDIFDTVSSDKDIGFCFIHDHKKSYNFFKALTGYMHETLFASIGNNFVVVADVTDYDDDSFGNHIFYFLGAGNEVKSLVAEGPEGLEMHEDINGFVIVRGVLYNYYGMEEAVSVPHGVTLIGSDSFARCEKIKSVAIPESVTTVASQAFFACSSLSGVQLSDSVTDIGGSAFYLCQNLMELNIPGSVTSIGDSAFNFCDLRFTIHAPAGSYAETYAKENEIPFVAE